jgi:hypothetical protein
MLRPLVSGVKALIQKGGRGPATLPRPQRLKPKSFRERFGTAEAVPFPVVVEFVGSVAVLAEKRSEPWGSILKSIIYRWGICPRL